MTLYQTDFTKLSMKQVRVRGLWLHKKGLWYWSRMQNGKKITVTLPEWLSAENPLQGILFREKVEAAAGARDCRVEEVAVEEIAFFSGQI